MEENKEKEKKQEPKYNGRVVDKQNLEQMLKQNGKKAIVLMTYRRVEDFRPGVYGDGRLIIYGWEGHDRSNEGKREQAQRVVDEFYEQFNLRQDADLIEHVFVYAGTNALDQSLQAAGMINHDWKTGERGKDITLVCCHCDMYKKEQVAHRSYAIELIKADCGGQYTMKKIAEHILDGTNPGDIGDFGYLKTKEK